MIAYNLDYSNLIMNPSYDTDEVSKIVIPINAHETIKIVQQAGGVIPTLLKKLLKHRKAIKRRMREEKNPDMVTILDMAQKAAKVICNATYGFTGAESVNPLAVRDVMHIVTHMGRYLQRQTAHFCSAEYGMVGVYGDTDSVFPLLQIPRSATKNMESLVSFLDTHYRMSTPNHPFTWQSVVAHYRTRRKGHLTYCRSLTSIK